ncbi:hypothetical protein FVE85_8279 [Porphyridium purpureum]|uniref:Conserved virulence factor B-like winged helix domain-containing protein n=1 Tax=Porphyridium purpureum TaxID=35688 RepID=A0A5J4YN04_PORPP|nr:hypothetical protein FVE85_8279 [Porphyridium purpureum]|eukprot:POR9470..scf244_11
MEMAFVGLANAAGRVDRWRPNGEIPARRCGCVRGVVSMCAVTQSGNHGKSNKRRNEELLEAFMKSAPVGDAPTAQSRVENSGDMLDWNEGEAGNGGARRSKERTASVQPRARRSETETRVPRESSRPTQTRPAEMLTSEDSSDDETEDVQSAKVSPLSDESPQDFNRHLHADLDGDGTQEEELNTETIPQRRIQQSGTSSAGAIPLRRKARTTPPAFESAASRRTELSRQDNSFLFSEDGARDSGRGASRERTLKYPERKTRMMDLTTRRTTVEKLGLERGVPVEVYVERLTPLGARVAVSVPAEKRATLNVDDDFPSGVWVEGALFKTNLDAHNKQVAPGDVFEAFVGSVREDGLLDISLEMWGANGRSDAMERIRELIREHGGQLPITDKADAEEIRALVNMPKRKFKLAVGGLLKNCEIVISPEGIRGTDLMGKINSEAAPSRRPAQKKGGPKGQSA